MAQMVFVATMKQFAESFYKSKQWQRMREYIFRRDKGLCMDCLQRGMINSAEEIHHIIPITQANINDTSITLNEDNLISLCRECHRQRHSNKQRRFTVGDDGKIFVR